MKLCCVFVLFSVLSTVYCVCWTTYYDTEHRGRTNSGCVDNGKCTTFTTPWKAHVNSINTKVQYIVFAGQPTTILMIVEKYLTKDVWTVMNAKHILHRGKLMSIRLTPMVDVLVCGKNQDAQVDIWIAILEINLTQIYLHAGAGHRLGPLEHAE
uniref:Uncharacterized protein n=1 Tax=Rhodnius prolixus TaxID=13249 RepID=T1HKL8_RHOPR